ncbi:MAG TPA: hypothetical protein V6D30_10380 [Leptolyngbyaceae cyanobacterium]
MALLYIGISAIALTVHPLHSLMRSALLVPEAIALLPHVCLTLGSIQSSMFRF